MITDLDLDVVAGQRLALQLLFRDYRTDHLAQAEDAPLHRRVGGRHLADIGVEVPVAPFPRDSAAKVHVPARDLTVHRQLAFGLERPLEGPRQSVEEAEVLLETEGVKL